MELLQISTPDWSFYVAWSYDAQRSNWQQIKGVQILFNGLKISVVGTPCKEYFAFSKTEVFLPAWKVDQVKSVGNRSKFHKRKRKVLSFNSNKMIDAFLQKLSKKRHMCVKQQSSAILLSVLFFVKLKKNLLSLLEFILIYFKTIQINIVQL